MNAGMNETKWFRQGSVYIGAGTMTVSNVKGSKRSSKGNKLKNSVFKTEIILLRYNIK